MIPRGRPAGNDIAVPCYRYIALPADPTEEILSDRFGITGWNRIQEHESLGKDYRQPFRALVKEFIDSEATIVNPRKMLQDLKDLRKMGVFQGDIYARN